MSEVSRSCILLTLDLMVVDGQLCRMSLSLFDAIEAIFFWISLCAFEVEFGDLEPG